MRSLVPALVAAAILCGYSARADLVYVEPASGTGASASELEAVRELVHDAVPEVSADSTTDDEAKAGFSLRPRLIRLAEAYILSLSKIRGGEVVFSSELKAAGFDEIDKVAKRLTRSVLLGENAPAHPRVGEITNQEAFDGAQRKPTRRAMYLGFGGTTLGNLDSSGIGYSFGIAMSWDVNVARLKLLAEGDFDGAAFFASGGIGADYFLSREDISPYVSADFGAGAAKVDGGSVFSGQLVGGFVAGVGGGVEFLRTSSVNMDLSFRAGFLLHSNDLGIPNTLSLRLGLYF